MTIALSGAAYWNFLTHKFGVINASRIQQYSNMVLFPLHINSCIVHCIFVARNICCGKQRHSEYKRNKESKKKRSRKWKRNFFSGKLQENDCSLCCSISCALFVSDLVIGNDKCWPPAELTHIKNWPHLISVWWCR